MKIKNFLLSALKGAAIGIAMIIPGVSGGTLAVLLGIYDQMIDAISNLTKKFKESFLFLLPIVIGALVGIVAMYFPLKYALTKAPLATILLFAGLMLGSCPKIVKDGLKKGSSPINILSFILPLAVVLGICFIPGLGEADLSSSMPVWGYFVLLLIGAVASCALVIPGVSGSMLLLIFGYYNPILATFSSLNLHYILVLALFAVGIIVGFFTIAKLMKVLLTRFPRGTTYAIIGFVIGSIPAIFITFNGNFPDHTYAACSTVEIIVGTLLLVVGTVATYLLTHFVEKKNSNL
jgi:putative membrane protein